MSQRGRLPSSVGSSARVALIAMIALTCGALPEAAADTMDGSLALAYQNNPQLNAQRAATRATDESVGIALSGYRPRITGTATSGEQYLDTLTRSPPLG